MFNCFRKNRKKLANWDTTEMGLHRETPIATWDEAMPLGNGEFGGLVWGDSKKVIISVDRGDIWDTTVCNEDNEGFNYPTICELVKSKNFKRITEIFDTPYHENPSPTKLTTGRLEINVAGDSKDISFDLDFRTAECIVDIAGKKLSTFIHSTSRVGMIKADSLSADVNIINPKYGKKTDAPAKKGVAVSMTLSSCKYDDAVYHTQVVSKNGKNINVSWFVQPIDEKFSYGVFLAELDGNYSYFASQSNFENWEAEAIELITDSIIQGYDSLIASHKEWWSEFWSKSSITIPNKTIEKHWYYVNYLLGSASREGQYPMPLQGLWTADDGVNLPPWRGDYHNDLNTELTYYSYLKSNHVSEGKSFVDYLLSLTETARICAKRIYGAKEGIVLPCVMDINGRAMGGWAQYSMSPTNHLWLCQSLERHFTYTNDMDFLRDKAYPFMRDSAKFILSIMTIGEHGKYILPWSSSPEIHDNTPKAFVMPNSNYDLSLIRYLLGALIKFSDKLGFTEDSIVWTEKLRMQHELAVSKKNVFMLSPNEVLKESHRHHAHMMAIHPLRLVTADDERDNEIISASLRNMEKLGTKLWTGYSFGWLAELYICERNAEKAERAIDNFVKYFCLPNGFHCNGDITRQGLSLLKYRPFTLEGNFVAADSVQEMLLYSENDEIEVFYCVPSSWSEAEFSSLRACGGLLISAKRRKGKTQEIIIQATTNYSFKLRGDMSEMMIDGKKIDSNMFSMKAGEVMTITRK